MVRAALSVYDATVSELLQYELQYHRDSDRTRLFFKLVPVTGITNNLDNITERGVCMFRGHLVGAGSFESALEMVFLKLMGALYDGRWQADPQTIIDDVYDVRLLPPPPRYRLIYLRFDPLIRCSMPSTPFRSSKGNP